MPKTPTVLSAMRALFTGFLPKSEQQKRDAAYDPAARQRWRNNAGTDYISIVGLDSSDRPIIAGGMKQRRLMPVPITIQANATAANMTKVIYIAPRAGMRLEAVTEVHKTAGDDSGAVTWQITKETISGSAAGTGASLLASAGSFKSTAATVVTPTLASNLSLRTLNANDRLSLKVTGTTTTLAGVCITLYFSGAHGVQDVVVFPDVAAAGPTFWVANYPQIISSIKYAHGTKAAAASNCQVEKLTGTTAVGSGTELLTNNTNAGFDTNATANVVQTGALSATAANLRLAAGDRLGLDHSGTTTSLAQPIYVVTLSVRENRWEIPISIFANGDLVDQYIWISNGTFEVKAARQSHGTAGTGAINVQLTKDISTDAPGAGTDLITDDSNAGFQLEATAATVQNGGLVAEGVKTLLSGDRLSVDYAGTLTSVADCVVVASIEYA